MRPDPSPGERTGRDMVWEVRDEETGTYTHVVLEAQSTVTPARPPALWQPVRRWSAACSRTAASWCSHRG